MEKNMHVRVGQHSVTFDKHWEIWEDVPFWSPGVEWEWDDYEVTDSSRHALLLYSNPTDRYWEFFRLPEQEVALNIRMDRVADRGDDEYVGVWYVGEL
jgi:hypothetical protein